MAQRPQEAAIQPGDCPTVPPEYPSFRNRHTHGTQHTQHSRRPQGPDYKTTRLQTQPANRKHNKKNTEKPSRGSLQRQRQQSKDLYVASANKGANGLGFKVLP